MRNLLFTLLLAVPLSAETTVTLLHVSDYHSHALPFYTDEGERGGIARAYEYLRREKRRGALVFNGGDTMNKGAPAWSDRYRCAEWAWLNGIVDAMALGNHEPDYGAAELERCSRSIRYPILSANTDGFQPYAIFNLRGVRIGVFAIAGNDFSTLVAEPGFQFAEAVAAAKRVVRELREDRRVDAVVMIGHQHAEADYALAREVAGIDLIFGTHSHLVRELVQIPETSTWFISPGQYLSYISRIEITFEGGKVRSVTGELVPVDSDLRENRRIASRVRRMQRALERDPHYRDLFLPIGHLDGPQSVDALTRITVERMRSVTGADVALTTRSSVRRPLPSGVLTMELLRGSLPYDNQIVVCSMSGRRLQQVFAFSAERGGTGSEAVFAGAVLIDPLRDYKVATTDYLANIAYRSLFDCGAEPSGSYVRDEVRKLFAATDSLP